jgi:hypothetical protein
MLAPKGRDEARQVARRLWDLCDQFENPPVEIGKPMPGQFSVYGVVQSWNLDVGRSLFRRYVATCHRDVIRSLRRRAPTFRHAVAEEFQQIELVRALRELDARVAELVAELPTQAYFEALRQSVEALLRALKRAA